MAHLWSGRFEGNPDAALVAFGRSFGFDRRLFEDDVRGSLAWAAALARAGVLSAADAAAIEAGLQEVLSRSGDEAFFNSPDAQQDEDVHAFVERELVARIGAPGRRLHTGRSRNEPCNTVSEGLIVASRSSNPAATSGLRTPRMRISYRSPISLSCLRANPASSRGDECSSSPDDWRCLLQ